MMNPFKAIGKGLKKWWNWNDGEAEARNAEYERYLEKIGDPEAAVKPAPAKEEAK